MSSNNMLHDLLRIEGKSEFAYSCVVVLPRAMVVHGGPRLSAKDIVRFLDVAVPERGARVRILGAGCWGTVQKVMGTVACVRLDGRDNDSIIIECPVWAIDLDLQTELETAAETDDAQDAEKMEEGCRASFKKHIVFQSRKAVESAHHCKILSVKEGDSEECLRAAWMKAVRRAHPDKGGHADTFTQLQDSHIFLCELLR
jgi:hypothetical protein